jgi:hypothetical protein
MREERKLRGRARADRAPPASRRILECFPRFLLVRKRLQQRRAAALCARKSGRPLLPSVSAEASPGRQLSPEQAARSPLEAACRRGRDHRACPLGKWVLGVHRPLEHKRAQWRRSGLATTWAAPEDIDRVALYHWGGGGHGVDTVREIVKPLLLGGSIGREGTAVSGTGSRRQCNRTWGASRRSCAQRRRRIRAEDRRPGACAPRA